MGVSKCFAFGYCPSRIFSPMVIKKKKNARASKKHSPRHQTNHFHNLCPHPGRGYFDQNPALQRLLEMNCQINRSLQRLWGPLFWIRIIWKCFILLSHLTSSSVEHFYTFGKEQSHIKISHTALLLTLTFLKSTLFHRRKCSEPLVKRTSSFPHWFFKHIIIT